MDCIHRLHYRRLVGAPFRGDYVLYWFALVCLDKLDFYALDGIMGEIGLLLAGWYSRLDRMDRRVRGWYGGTGASGRQIASATIGF